MTRTTFVVACLAAVAAVGSSAPAREVSTQASTHEGHDIIIGRSLAFTSKALGRTIPLDVALPEGYATGQDRYPVLFAFQNQLLHVQGVVDAMSRAAAVPPMIVVAVGVPGDLFELYARDGKPGPSRAARVLEFLRDELEPFIDASYRTVPYRIVLGHSASALFGLWAAFTAPDAIQALLAAGPMFPDYDYARVAEMLETAITRRPDRPQFLFVTQGIQPELTRDLTAFRQLLASAPASRAHRRVRSRADVEPQLARRSDAARRPVDALPRVVHAARAGRRGGCPGHPCPQAVACDAIWLRHRLEPARRQPRARPVDRRRAA